MSAGPPRLHPAVIWAEHAAAVDATQRALLTQTMAAVAEQLTAPPPRKSLQLLLADVGGGSTHAAIVLCTVARRAPKRLLAAAVTPLAAAASPHQPAALRGWALRSLAHLACYDDAAPQLLPALPTLLAALDADATHECKAWAAEALGALCAPAKATSAHAAETAVRAGAISRVLGAMESAGGDEAEGAATRARRKLHG